MSRLSDHGQHDLNGVNSANHYNQSLNVSEIFVVKKYQNTKNE